MLSCAFPLVLFAVNDSPVSAYWLPTAPRYTAWIFLEQPLEKRTDLKGC